MVHSNNEGVVRGKAEAIVHLLNYMDMAHLM